MEEDNTQYYNDEWNIEKKIFINGIEQINISSSEKPYYIPKPSQEELEIIQKEFNSKNNKPDGRRYKK